MKLMPARTEFVEVAPSDLDSDSSQGSKHHLHSIRLRRPMPSAQKSSAAKSGVLDEAYDEFCRLHEAGKTVDPDEFCARYPRIQSSLARLIEAHRFLDENPHLMGDSLPEAWPESGEDFAGFSLLGELGHGAFARVFQAREPALGNRLVAIKISREIATEAAILGRLNHPNIVPVYSVCQEPATHLSVVCMPYLGSATLCQVLDRLHADGNKLTDVNASVILEAAREPGDAPPPPAAALLRHGTYVDGVRWIGLRLAEALAFIHGQGICHRDLKPSNVLLKPDGTPMLLDFNLSTDVLLPETKVGGTPLYMAPEQLSALERNQTDEVQKTDGRSDLFSLGVILYELLTGTHPFGPIPLKLPSADLRRHLLNRQLRSFRPIRELNPAVDKGLASAVEACLAVKVEDRPASAAQLAKLLRKGFTPVRRLGRFLLRHPKAVAAACVLMMTFTAAGAYHVATQDPAVVREYKQAVEAYKQGHHKVARDHLQRVLEEQPQNFDARFLLARSLEKLGDEGRAKFELTKAIGLNHDGEVYAYWGFLLQKTKWTDEAVLKYEEAIAKGFANAEIYLNIAEKYSKKPDERATAEKYLLEAYRVDPNSSAANFFMARLYLQRATAVSGQMSESRPDYTILKAEQLGFAQQGLMHIRRAIEVGPVTTDMAMLAARLAAVAARHDASWQQPTIGYLQEAIKLGQNPAKLAEEKTLRVVADKPEFLALCQMAQVGAPTQVPRFFDPIRD